MPFSLVIRDFCVREFWMAQITRADCTFFCFIFRKFFIFIALDIGWDNASLFLFIGSPFSSFFQLSRSENLFFLLCSLPFPTPPSLFLSLFPSLSHSFSLPSSFFLFLSLSFHSVFQGFRQAKSDNGGLILSLSQFLILPQLPQKMKLASKVVKVDSKIIISLSIPLFLCPSLPTFLPLSLSISLYIFLFISFLSLFLANLSKTLSLSFDISPHLFQFNAIWAFPSKFFCSNIFFSGSFVDNYFCKEKNTTELVVYKNICNTVIFLQNKLLLCKLEGGLIFIIIIIAILFWCLWFVLELLTTQDYYM